MSDRGPNQSVHYCQECGTELRSDTRYCTQCGAEQPVGHQPSDRPPHHPQPHTRPEPRQPTNGGRSTFETVVLAVGVLVGAVIVIPIVSAIIAAFVLGLGGEQVDEPVSQVQGEITVEAYYQGLADGDEASAEAQLHSAGPAAENSTTAPGREAIFNSNGVVTVLDSTIVRRGTDTIVLSIELEVDEIDEQPETRTIRVELQTEDGSLRIWEFR